MMSLTRSPHCGANDLIELVADINDKIPLPLVFRLEVSEDLPLLMGPAFVSESPEFEPVILINCRLSIHGKYATDNAPVLAVIYQIGQITVAFIPKIYGGQGKSCRCPLKGCLPRHG